jgi:hypothetical protein
MKPSIRLILANDHKSQEFAVYLLMCLVYGGLASAFCLFASFPTAASFFAAATLVGSSVFIARIVWRILYYRRNAQLVEFSWSEVHTGINHLYINDYAVAGQGVSVTTSADELTAAQQRGGKLSVLIDTRRPSESILCIPPASRSKAPLFSLPRKDNNDRFAFYLGLGGLIIGLGLFITLGYFDIKTIASQKWPSTDGSIIYSYIRTEERSEEVNDRTEYYTAYCLEIAYRYQVAGINFKGEKYNIGSECDRSSEWAGSVVAQYQAGDSARVYYNPRHPAEAILLVEQVAKMDYFFMAAIFVGVILPTFGLLLYSVSPRLQARLRRTSRL